MRRNSRRNTSATQVLRFPATKIGFFSKKNKMYRDSKTQPSTLTRSQPSALTHSTWDYQRVATRLRFAKCARQRRQISGSLYMRIFVSQLYFRHAYNPSPSSGRVRGFERSTYLPHATRLTLCHRGLGHDKHPPTASTLVQQPVHVTHVLTFLSTKIIYSFQKSSCSANSGTCRSLLSGTSARVPHHFGLLRGFEVQL